MDQNTNNIPVEEGSKGLSIAALVCGIVSITLGCCCTFVGLPTSIAAIICGAISISKSKPGKGMAIAGLVMGIISIVLLIVSFILNAAGVFTMDYQNILNQVQ